MVGSLAALRGTAELERPPVVVLPPQAEREQAG
jgi:hypothetical protein